MAYSDFTLTDIKEKLFLFLNEKESLFSTIEPLECSQHLKETLKFNIPLAVSIDTEKARSELIVTPVLVEVIKQSNQEVSLFSGIEFNVDKNKGLNGTCDYMLSLSKEQLFIDVPIIVIVEAKNDRINTGIGQCISEMLAAKLYNEKKENAISNIYGVITTGSLFKFLKLNDKTVWIDIDEYHISNVSKIMGIFMSIVNS
ncbi:MAG: hypothetical protein DRR00_18460 [Candidatus Parabeggiatoa sp. nov. 3]|nr:MAG: hypothetical protein DRR00_18460 [Gammaproteobacteria bacterium]RKZ64694.1 MAG: hypothetical protein DRQ99_14980 [Gammaproteobacteria bacterium]